MPFQIIGRQNQHAGNFSAGLQPADAHDMQRSSSVRTPHAFKPAPWHCRYRVHQPKKRVNIPGQRRIRPRNQTPAAFKNFDKHAGLVAQKHLAVFFSTALEEPLT